MRTTIPTLRFIVLVTAAFFIAADFAGAQVLINGNFETGTNPGFDFINVPTGNSTTISGWTVSSGDVDYIGGRWRAAGGNRSVDLNGNGTGSISQTVTGLASGQGYHIYFYMAASPDAPAGASRSMQVSMGSASGIFTAIGTYSNSDPGWSQRVFDFTATSSSMTLTFLSLASGPWGPALDEVSITPVPEPSVVTLGTVALGLMMFLNRKRNQSAN